ncbi:MAG TPA: hypothetical protein VHV30_15615 [Polyangiaceae bacterium]|jgi:hypothetical protein|nr:hypothetical protein [Polyangiaceae bacterium]
MPSPALAAIARDPLARVLGVWLVATLLAAALVRHAFALDASGPLPVVASVWIKGHLAARAALPSPDAHDAQLDAARAGPGATLVYETVVGEGPVLVRPQALLAVSLVPGHDGLAVTLGGRTEYLTPDDLLSRQAYDKGVELASLGFKAGIDATLALAILSDRFATTVPDLLDHARFRRVRVARSVPGAPPGRVVSPETMTRDDVQAAVLDAASFLARGVDDRGRFRYVVDAPTNATLPGYDWPRHSGATYFLAQAADLTHSAFLRAAALRAAGYLRDHATVDCGDRRCVGDGRVVDLGSTALAVIAFAEIARTKLDVSYANVVAPLADFLRSQQRPDGDFMHEYDRRARKPIDVQLLYYTGEASLALSRAATLLGDAGDQDAASRALARLVGTGWRFFGSRYYFGEEHWTCQAMEDLWSRAPDRAALDFCLRWQAYDRKLQYGPGDTPYDADGAYGFGPVVTPRLTPVGSRAEAGIATLDVATRTGAPASEVAALDGEMRRSLALLLRHQFRPGPRYLFADPAAVEGAMPASEVDWQLRIDFAQHAGSAMVRWLALQTSSP